MAIAEMKKLLLVGLENERAKLFKKLQKLGCAEVVNIKAIEQQGVEGGESEITLKKPVVDTKISVLQLKIARLKFAFEFLKIQVSNVKKAVKKGQACFKAPMPDIGAKPVITFEQFATACENEKEVFGVVEKLERLSDKLVELKAEQVKIRTLLEQVKPYSMIDASFDLFCDTLKTSFILGTIPAVKEAEFDGIVAGSEFIYAEKYGEKNTRAVVVICPIENREALSEKLSSIDFTACNISSHKKPEEIVGECNFRLFDIDIEKIRASREAVDYYDRLASFRLMYDFYNVEMQKAEAEGKTLETSKAFIAEAWIPAMREEAVIAALDQSKLAVAFEISAPAIGDNVPTLCVNNSFVTPYETVTNMYSSPSYSEIDPNPFVSVFFILFFGMMVSDAGYGLAMTLGCSAILLVKKFRKNEGGMIKVLLAGGLSTVFWGIMFGSYFGMELIKPVMFSPLTNPLAMMGLALGVGLLQMVVGMGINAFQLFRQKKPLEAIFGVLAWYVVFLGLGLTVVGMLVKIPALSYVGYGLLGLGFVGVLLHGARGKKGFKKVTGAFGNVYQAINIMSDLLSYTRLFGLGLATGVIGMVVNQIAGVIMGMIPVVGVVLAIFIGIVGHAFNISINVLGAYVHNARLQYVEFFGKFYTGGAKLFNPLGSNMKYYNIQE